jgi:superfamily II RNA helicase
VKEEDEAAVLLGMTAYHEGQLPVWQNFLRNLLQNDLIKLVFATESLLQHTHICVRTVVISSVVRNTHAGNSLLPTSDFWQLQDVAGRRGVDAEGTVVFLKSLQSGPKEAASVVSESPPAISSAFTPSYNLLLNLVSKYSLPQVIINHGLENFITMFWSSDLALIPRWSQNC